MSRTRRNNPENKLFRNPSTFSTKRKIEGFILQLFEEEFKPRNRDKKFLSTDFYKSDWDDMVISAVFERVKL